MRKAKHSKASFADLVDRIDWMMISPLKASWKMRENEVALGFSATDPKKAPDKINRVIIRFGNEVMQKMKWKYKDKLVVMHDPDDLMNFYIVKTENGQGFTIGRESASNNGRLQFKWSPSISLDKRKCLPVKYNIHKGALIILRKENENFEDDDKYGDDE